MGELTEQRWAVLSARGREADGLTYAEALRLRRRLESEKLYGLCVVTDEAARRTAGAVDDKQATKPAAPG